jgi:hypothetical protein
LNSFSCLNRRSIIQKINPFSFCGGN